MKTKAISALLCAFMLFSLLAACGGGSEYRNDVSTSEIGDAIDAVVGGDDVMIDASDMYISVNVKLPISDYAAYCIRVNSMGINIDEYGIFKAKDSKQVQDIKADIEAYFQRYRDRWMPEYMPGEYPKLENAEIRVAGNYVMYALLSDSMRAEAFSAFENALK